jgi:hypothetical protein
MRTVKQRIGLGWLLVFLLMASCSRPPEVEQSPEPATSTPVETATVVIEPTDTPSQEIPETTPAVVETDTPTVESIDQPDLDNALEVVRSFLAGVAQGEFRTVYGSLLTTVGQRQLADLLLGRLALENPYVSYFELVGAEPLDGRIAVDAVWEESYEGQGLVGTQQARFLLARQDGQFLIDAVDLAEYEPAATPVPPPLPRAEALTNPAVPGEEMRFQATGFQSDEAVLAWLELPDGSLLDPVFQVTNTDGSFEVTYAGDVTSGLAAGRWIWWAQALRDSTRNTGISFQVLEAPTPTATPTPQPTQPRPTSTPQPAAAPEPTPTPTPEPASGYGAPVALWPELETSRDYGSALIVEFVPVAEELAPDEFYELVLTARDGAGNIYNSGSIQGKGDVCQGQYDQPCRSLIAGERFMRLFHPEGIEGRGSWIVQVARETEPGQFTAISPPSEPRVVILKPRP